MPLLLRAADKNFQLDLAHLYSMSIVLYCNFVML